MRGQLLVARLVLLEHLIVLVAVLLVVKLLLQIGGNALGDAGATAVADGLRRNARLRRLGLERTGIGATGADALADALAVNTALRSLGLAHNRCGASGVAALAGALRLTAAPLRELDLEHNGAALGGGGTAVDALAAALGGDAPLPPTLRHLRLAGNGLGLASRRRLRAAPARRRGPSRAAGAPARPRRR